MQITTVTTLTAGTVLLIRILTLAVHLHRGPKAYGKFRLVLHEHARGAHERRSDAPHPVAIGDRCFHVVLDVQRGTRIAVLYPAAEE